MLYLFINKNKKIKVNAKRYLKNKQLVQTYAVIHLAGVLRQS